MSWHARVKLMGCAHVITPKFIYFVYFNNEKVILYYNIYNMKEYYYTTYKRSSCGITQDKKVSSIILRI